MGFIKKVGELSHKMGVQNATLVNKHCYMDEIPYKTSGHERREFKDTKNYNPRANKEVFGREFYAKGGAVDRQELAVGAVAKVRKGQY